VTIAASAIEVLKHFRMLKTQCYEHGVKLLAAGEW
jgi:hypothetical protein